MIFSKKDFLPYEYFTKKNLENEKEDNKGLKILIIFALILFPFTAKAFNEKNEKAIDNKVQVVESKNYFEDIGSWIEIYDGNITGEINGNIGNFKIEDKNIISKINKSNTLKVVFFEKIEEGGYNIRVQRE